MQYELSYILKGDLEEAKHKEVTQGLVGFVSKIGQGLKVIMEPKLQSLAYPIKKQTQGFWGALEFSLEGEKLPELEKKLKDTKEIIRFMLTKVSRRKAVEKKEKPAQSQASGRARRTAELSAGKKKKLKEAPKKEPKEEKVEIKDLDKKLDEILKEV